MSILILQWFIFALVEQNAMKINVITIRQWFSEHSLSAALLFVAFYQLVDVFLNYYASGDLQQGFIEFYQSDGGREDLLRFFILLLLFSAFAIFSKNIILELRKANDDESRRVNEIKNFAHSVIHDVKNPAIGIHLMTTLIKKKYREAIDDHGKHYLEILEQNSRDIVELLDQVNIFIKSREYPLTFENIKLQNEIDFLREGINPTLELRGIQWFQEPQRFPDIRGDRMSIHRIFRNLIDNAIKYGGDDLNRIILEYEESAQSHVFLIGDNGCGIDECEQETLFELFRRGKTSGRVEGMGLGLAIVKELVERHNGTVQMNSVSGKGTTFIFSVSKDL